MKRKRGSVRRKPKKTPVPVANNASANSSFLNAEGYSGDHDGCDGFDPTMEGETAHANATLSSFHQGLDEPAFPGETNGGNSIQNGNLLKSVASFAAKLSRTVGSSIAKPSDKALLLQGEKSQGKKPRLFHQDPQNNEQELNAALVVIKKIMKTDAAKPFNAPVDPAALGIPDYFDAIVSPMDFGTICNNLELGLKYRDAADVYKDVQLIWDNCSKYNKKGDYTLELMKRAKSNFIKHWNAAGLFRHPEEADNVHLEADPQDTNGCFTRHNKEGHMFPAGSMINNSIHHERPDLVGLYQVQRQEYSPCFSHMHSQHICSQCQCECQSSEFQSFQRHCSRHRPTAGRHMCSSGPISGEHYSQRQDEIRPFQKLSCQSSPSCGTQSHSCERPYKYQSNSSHLQPSSLLSGRDTQTAGHVHLPIHGVSSSSTCNICEHACSSVPMSYNSNHHKHYQMCSCPINEHQSLLRCCDQYQQHQNSCQHYSHSSQMRNTEPDVRDAGNAVESTVRHTEGRLRYPMAPVTDGSSHQQQCQMGPSQVPSSPTMYSNSCQPQGKRYQCQLDFGHSERPLPEDRPNIGGAEHSNIPPHAESTIRHETDYSGSPDDNDDRSDEQEFQLGPNELQSPLLGQSDEPKEDGPQFQPSSSQPEPPMPQSGVNMTDADHAGLERKTRGRGPTRCLKLLVEGMRISVTTNELGQPVGPEASKLVSFLGTLARNGNLAPLTYVDWRAVPEESKENMWEEVQKKFEIDPNSKSWVIKSLGKKWKDWKSKLKTAHYITHATDEERLADRDERVLPEQWAYLVSHWSSEEAEKRSATNRANRAQQKFGHVTGTKSFARIREEQRVKRSDGKAPSRAELFILTRTRKDGKPVNEASSAVITQLREIGSQPQNAFQNNNAGGDVFSQVVGRDRHGRVRCLGLGPSPSDFVGQKPTQAEAMKMVTEANDEVRQMKERLVAMEQTCTQMAQQMATMMSMMSSMQKNSTADNVPDVVVNGSGSSEGSPDQQVQSLPLRRSSRKGKF
ncbi:uncharacterized protein LOC113759381 isoform X1 [Coffea eugenioides]|uniref:uncharacterized protein LOC113759381 isoform X1 n=1 Tax=Coffea eugenioides TaxID=49369 RepID=UPI000F605E35|nr:uncharacterized protein LOC113759381 isoform X1 [Coffea eugenioides]XP_027157750.1 uncharacterized protein LOC113759381 isoform X1 [Coffea eugenioides]